MPAEISAVSTPPDEPEIATSGAHEHSATTAVGKKRKADDEPTRAEKKQTVNEDPLGRGKGKTKMTEEETAAEEQAEHVNGDEDLGDLIVTGKRTRKHVDYSSKEAMQTAGIDLHANVDDDDGYSFYETSSDEDVDPGHDGEIADDDEKGEDEDDEQ